MTDQDAVLAANLEFYRAFATRDLKAMDALWARRVPVACLHPGWTALKDRDAIIESWAGILSNLTRHASRVLTSTHSFMAMWRWCCVRRSSKAALSPRATSLSAKTGCGGLPTTKPARSSGSRPKNAVPPG
jgi:hypothetical protein